MSSAKHIISEKAAEAVDAAIAEALGDAYDCTRVWSAWGFGTMGPGDFHCIADDGDRIAEIRNEAIAALQPEFAALKRQRDELLAALKQVQVDISNGNCVMADTAVFVDAAIADVEQPGATPAADADGWIEWNGGECPVPDGTPVIVKYRMGLIDGPLPALHNLGGIRDAGRAFWCNYGNPDDIIAYRVVQGGAA